MQYILSPFRTQNLNLYHFPTFPSATISFLTKFIEESLFSISSQLNCDKKRLDIRENRLKYCTDDAAIKSMLGNLLREAWSLEWPPALSNYGILINEQFRDFQPEELQNTFTLPKIRRICKFVSYISTQQKKWSICGHADGFQYILLTFNLVLAYFIPYNNLRKRI